MQPGLLRYLRGLVGDDAEDVASETWGQIARDLGSFEGDSDGFRGWAATIARHRGLDHLRWRQRRPSVSMPVAALTDLVAADDTSQVFRMGAATRRAVKARCRRHCALGRTRRPNQSPRLARPRAARVARPRPFPAAPTASASVPPSPSGPARQGRGPSQQPPHPSKTK